MPDTRHHFALPTWLATCLFLVAGILIGGGCSAVAVVAGGEHRYETIRCVEVGDSIDTYNNGRLQVLRIDRRGVLVDRDLADGYPGFYLTSEAMTIGNNEHVKVLRIDPALPCADIYHAHDSRGMRKLAF